VRIFSIGEHGQPSGKYRYSLFCTTDVYYVLIINEEEEIEIVTDYIAICARPASYAWGVDYEPDFSGNFGKTAAGD
jgi:hypothetical protein